MLHKASKKAEYSSAGLPIAIRAVINFNEIY